MIIWYDKLMQSNSILVENKLHLPDQKGNCPNSRGTKDQPLIDRWFGKLWWVAAGESRW